MNSAMSIGFALTRFLHGGIENTIEMTMRNFIKDGHDAELFTGNHVSWMEDLKQNEVRIGKIPIISTIFSINAFSKALQKSDIDVINAFCYPSSAGAEEARKKTCIPVVRHSPGPEPSHINSVESGMKFSFIKKTYERADAIVAPSGWSRDYIKRVFGVESEVIPPSVDTERFSPKNDMMKMRSKLGIPEDSKVILFVGHILSRKGVDDLIAASIRLLKDIPDARVVFVGNGCYQHEIDKRKDFIKKNGIGDKVIFTGQVSDDDMPSYYAACDLFCLPSWEEGFGNVFMEAMSSGKPIISTRVSAIPYVVEDGKTGILVEPRNPDMLSNALISMISDERRLSAMSKNARKKAISLYSWNSRSKALLKLYRRLF